MRVYTDNLFLNCASRFKFTYTVENCFGNVQLSFLLFFNINVAKGWGARRFTKKVYCMYPNFDGNYLYVGPTVTEWPRWTLLMLFRIAIQIRTRGGRCQFFQGLRFLSAPVRSRNVMTEYLKCNESSIHQFCDIF